MFAVWDNRDFAWGGTIFCELFGGVVFFGLLIAANEKYRAGDFLGVLQQVGGVGEPVEERSRRDHPPPGGDEHELSRFTGGDQGLGFRSLLLDIAGERVVARGALMDHAVAAGVGG